jgi:tetratricopeptide (TPR) repeat protein
MNSFQEVFAEAEEARIRGDNEKAVELYQKAADLLDQSSTADPIALHHMWGVALISLDRTDEAREHLVTAKEMTRSVKTMAAIYRDLSRSHLVDGEMHIALMEIDRSLKCIPLNDLAELGASLGFKARILLKQGKIDRALEMFGTADVLLQRSSNRHYELYNLLHFLEALVEHRLPFFDDNWADVEFTEAQTPRLRALVETYGGSAHQERAVGIIGDIFAEREC